MLLLNIYPNIFHRNKTCLKNILNHLYSSLMLVHIPHFHILNQEGKELCYKGKHIDLAHKYSCSNISLKHIYQCICFKDKTNNFCNLIHQGMLDKWQYIFHFGI